MANLYYIFNQDPPHELQGSIFSEDAKDNYTTDAPPDYDYDNQIPVYNDGKWEIVKNYKHKKVYDANGNLITSTSITLPDGTTDSAPPNEYSSLDDDGTWKEDNQRKIDYLNLKVIEALDQDITINNNTYPADESSRVYYNNFLLSGSQSGIIFNGTTNVNIDKQTVISILNEYINRYNQTYGKFIQLISS